jgi:hypothetical protein
MAFSGSSIKIKLIKEVEVAHVFDLKILAFQSTDREVDFRDFFVSNSRSPAQAQEMTQVA